MVTMVTELFLVGLQFKDGGKIAIIIKIDNQIVKSPYYCWHTARSFMVVIVTVTLVPQRKMILSGFWPGCLEQIMGSLEKIILH